MPVMIVKQYSAPLCHSDQWDSINNMKKKDYCTQKRILMSVIVVKSILNTRAVSYFNYMIKLFMF